MEALFLNAIVLGLLFAVWGYSFTLLFKLTKYLHFAYGELIVTSAYFCLLGSFLGFNILQSLIFVIPLMLLFGLLFAKLAPPGTNDHSVLLVSLGILLIFQSINLHIFSPDVQSVPLGIFGESLGVLSLGRYIIIIFAVAFLALLYYIFKNTNFGLSWRAAADNAEAAKIIGIDVKKIYLITFLLTALLAGFGGVGLSYVYAFTPYYGLEYLVLAILVAIIGGAGSIRGATIGGLIIGFIVVFTSYLIGALWENVILFGILVIVMLLRPQGLVRGI